MRFSVAFGVGVLVDAQSPSTVAAEIAAAETAAGETWQVLQSEVWSRPGCRNPLPLVTQTRPAEKIFDNLYVLSNDDVLAWVITTSDGLILIDTMYDRTVKEVIIDTMQKAGLDPAQIKFVYLTHKNSDRAGGAKYLQETYGRAFCFRLSLGREFFSRGEEAGHRLRFRQRRIWSSPTVKD